MAYRRKTLRIMRPETRKVAKLINELESTITRLKHALPEINDLEFRAKALDNAKNQICPYSNSPECPKYVPPEKLFSEDTKEA